MREPNVKDRILDATIELIGQCASIENVTIRDIAAKAGVGVGLINYHFQTKENLINQCVQKIIGNTINKFDELYKSLILEPVDKLRFLSKLTCTFLVKNQGISRASILSDLKAGSCTDNTSQTMEAYLPVMREIFGAIKNDKELYILTHILITSFQSAFLRRDTFIKSEKVDFYDAKDREWLVDSIIDTVLK